MWLIDLVSMQAVFAGQGECLMHIDELRAFQRAGAIQNLHSLVMTCRGRFLEAAKLLELRSETIDKLASFGLKASVDLWPLLVPFNVLTERYVEQFYTPQLSLFPGPGEKQDEKWGRYFYHALVPHLIASDEVVRSVLRAVRALPCRQPDQATTALSHYFMEMTLPDTRPIWAPECVVA